MAVAISGGCACGTVSYTADGPPSAMINCHCRDCQRATGSAFAAFVVVRRAALNIDGELRFHALVGESGGKIERGFCPVCGAPLVSRFARLPDFYGIAAGSLDDPSVYAPSLDVFTDSAQPWDHLAADTQKRPRGWT